MTVMQGIGTSDKKKPLSFAAKELSLMKNVINHTFTKIL
jgi:hypothetical protein